MWNIDSVLVSFRDLVPQYLSRGGEVTEDGFREYVRGIVEIKLRRKPSRGIIEWNDKEGIEYVYGKGLAAE